MDHCQSLTHQQLDVVENSSSAGLDLVKRGQLSHLVDGHVVAPGRSHKGQIIAMAADVLGHLVHLGLGTGAKAAHHLHVSVPESTVSKPALWVKHVRPPCFIQAATKRRNKGGCCAGTTFASASARSASLDDVRAGALLVIAIWGPGHTWTRPLVSG